MNVDAYEHVLACADVFEYGLSAHVFTNDVKRLMTTVHDCDIGKIDVNRGGSESAQGFTRVIATAASTARTASQRTFKNNTMYVHF